mmetsp:Transcript_9945/g.15275  ORF Transcript_9945/g.15275 Transcript_9945/m.15275 type:complete len:1481 (+) Transcript_9945:77-4519(+)
MNWLQKLDELATKLLPEEDLRDNSELDGNDDIMISDPLLDGFVHYDDREKIEVDNIEEISQNLTKPVQFQDSQVVNETKTEGLDFSTQGETSDDEPNNATKVPIVPETFILQNDDNHYNENNDDAKKIKTHYDEFSSIVNQATGDVTAEWDQRIHDRLNHAPERRFSSTSKQSDHRYKLPKEIDTVLNEGRCSEKTSGEHKKPRELPEFLECVTEKVQRTQMISEETHSDKNVKETKFTDPHLSKIMPNVVSSCSIMSDSAPKSLPGSLCTESGLPLQKIDIFDESVPDAINFDSPERLEQWNTSFEPLDAASNCLGVVHVRFLAAQRLICPIGSTVQPVTSLKPWKGKVRGECTEAFGSDKHGVCAKWDALNEASVCSMVHAWNSDDTPIPIIKVELIFKPLPLLEFSMCALNLSCRPLMLQPGIWKKQWCEASISKSDQLTHTHPGKDKNPLILFEAAFFPAASEDDEDQHLDVQSTTSKLGDMSTIASSHVLRTKNRLHLFKLQSLWIPSHCGVCKRSLVGYRRAFRCEACKIDCCKDCQVQIDLQIPCGSELARLVVDKSIQNTITIDNLLSTIAPPDKNYVQKLQIDAKNERSVKADSKVAFSTKINDEVNKKPLHRRVGRFRIKIEQACIFESPLPLDTDPAKFERSDNVPVSQGDYYIRVSCLESTEENRTTTVQCSGRPKFSSPEMIFDVPHYGTNYRLEVFDADSTHCVGTAFVTAQTLLQVHRDSLVEGSHLPHAVDKLESYQKRFKLELRTGIKRGFESTYLLPKKETKSNTSRGKKVIQPGSISGWVTFEARIEQEMSDLYGKNAIVCPSRSPNKLDLELVQLHISRLLSFLGAIQDAIKWYSWLISWDSPSTTLISLVIFVGLCLKFDMEYIGCLPIVVAIAAMIFNLVGRKSGRLKQRFIQQQKKNCIKEVIETSVDTSVCRTIGAVEICIKQGRNLRSQELGITSSVGCNVFWHPLRYCNDIEEEKKLISRDKLLEARHDIGQTEFLFNVNPEWKDIKQSTALSRMHRLSPNLERELSGRAKSVFGTSLVSGTSVIFPILQPIQRMKQPDKQNSATLLPWPSIMGAIVVQVRFGDVLNKLPGFEDTIGEVVIPISKLVLSNEIKGWFQVTKVKSTHFVVCDDNNNTGTPSIFLHLRWLPPDLDIGVSDADKEESRVLEEDMIRAASSNVLVQRDIIGNSLDALNTVRGIGGTLQSIQNTLGDIVDMLEMFRNIFNFADPRISFLILSALSILFLVLASIPTRMIVMLIGMVQYVVGLISKCQHWLSDRKVEFSMEKAIQADKGSKTQAQLNFQISTWATNAIRSIPTDEDLRKAYFWEGCRIGEEACSKIRMEKRVALLTKLWKAKWFSIVNLRVERQRGALDDWSWQDGYFAVVSGRQLLVWASEADFDAGEIPCKQISFSGHAGLAGLSPVELRALSESEISRVVNIFGRGDSSQLKLMLLLPDKNLKDELESIIMETMVKDD